MLFRYANLLPDWYKGNTHIHSTASDGGKTFPELAEMYAGAGYDFLFRTDHWVESDVEGDGAVYPLLWVDGMELDGCDHGGSEYHVVCLGKTRGITGEIGLVAAMEAARAQGALLILAHPRWMDNSQDDAMRYGFDGVEVYNHVCQWINGKGDSGVYWSLMLQRFPGTFGLASDDTHLNANHPGWNGGWIHVNAARREPDAILDAIRAGRFYSSQGPEIHRIEWDGAAIRVECSPARFIRLVGPKGKGARQGGFTGDLLTQAELTLPGGWGYVYLEIEDDHGRRAWTNGLFE